VRDAGMATEQLRGMSPGMLRGVFGADPVTQEAAAVAAMQAAGTRRVLEPASVLTAYGQGDAHWAHTRRASGAAARCQQSEGD
jgi:hypothetical protein